MILYVVQVYHGNRTVLSTGKVLSIIMEYYDIKYHDGAGRSVAEVNESLMFPVISK